MVYNSPGNLFSTEQTVVFRSANNIVIKRQYQRRVICQESDANLTAIQVR
jgi:hypothetical protein